MEPKKLTESQVKLMIFLYKNKRMHTRKQLIDLLNMDRNVISLSIKPLSGYFIDVKKEKTKRSGRKGELISLTEAGQIAIRAFILANKNGK